MKVSIPFVQAYRSRDKIFYYYRRSGVRVRLHGEPGSPQFMSTYSKIHASFEGTSPATDGNAYGTFGYMLTGYYASPEFRQLADSTKKYYRRYLDPLREIWGKVALEGLTSRVVRAWRNKFPQDKPGTANAALSSLNSLCAWGVKNEFLSVNPVAKVDAIRIKSDGWQAWPEAALQKFAAQATGAVRIAFMLALHTGQRRKDVLAMRWDAISDGGIAVKQSKTGKPLWVPLHPTLQAELSQVKRTGLTIVHRLDGQPYTDSGFASLWNRAQHEYDCANLPFHGLRRNATQALYEAGCTPQQVQAITGHETLEMVAHYGKGANQKMLAKQAMGRLVNRREDDGV